MTNSKNKALINLALLAVTLAVNTLGAFGLINGLSQKEVSDRYQTLITPSPFTFSIWSVIYGLLILALVLMVIKLQDPYYREAVEKLTVLIRLSFFLNILWIVTFSFVLIELSVVFIFLYVVVLAMILTKLLRINDGRHWLVPLAFGLNTGWLFIATVVNLSAMLVKWEWAGWGLSEALWAVITLIVAVLLVFLVLTRVKNAAFTLPIAWAFFGIYQAQDLMNREGGSMIQIAALFGMAVLIGMAAITWYRNGFRILPKQREDGAAGSGVERSR